MTISIRERRPACPANVHDSYSAARTGCVCPAAIRDRRRYNKRAANGYLVSRRRNAIGTIRRLHALQAMGWPYVVLAERAGRHQKTLSQIAQRPQKYVNVDLAEAVDRLYEQLCMTVGPSAKTRARAKANGWAPPLCWPEGSIDDPKAEAVGMPSRLDSIIPHSRFDPNVVARAICGERPRMSSTETSAAVDRLGRAGLSTADIADRLGIAERSVTRIRTRIRNQGQRADSAA